MHLTVSGVLHPVLKQSAFGLVLQEDVLVIDLFHFEGYAFLLASPDFDDAVFGHAVAVPGAALTSSIPVFQFLYFLVGSPSQDVACGHKVNIVLHDLANDADFCCLFCSHSDQVVDVKIDIVFEGHWKLILQEYASFGQNKIHLIIGYQHDCRWIVLHDNALLSFVLTCDHYHDGSLLEPLLDIVFNLLDYQTIHIDVC